MSKNVAKYKEIQEQKTELLFQYLRDIRDLNLEMKMLELSQEFAQIRHDHDKALAALLLREGK
jgi:hypothetical protein